MTKSQENQLLKKGLFTLKEAEKMGIPQYKISRLVRSGLISRVGRGLYIHTKASVSKDTSFQMAMLKFGNRSAIGGLTALFFYNLIEEVPAQTWVVVEPSVVTKEKGYRLIRTKSGTQIGINSEKGYRIVNIERALIEGLKFSTKVGLSLALKAVRKAIRDKKTDLQKLIKMAKQLELESVLIRHIETIKL